MELIPEIKEFLLASVWGILILGACGSILGGFVIYLVRKVASFFMYHKENVLLSFVYPYYKQIVIAEELHKNKSSSNDTELIIASVSASMFSLIIIIAIIADLLLLAIIILFFGIERPYPLVASVSLLLLLLHWSIKHIMFSTSLVGERTSKQYDAIVAEQPKTYKEWRKLGDIDS